MCVTHESKQVAVPCQDGIVKGASAVCVAFLQSIWVHVADDYDDWFLLANLYICCSLDKFVQQRFQVVLYRYLLSVKDSVITIKKSSCLALPGYIRTFLSI